MTQSLAESDGEVASDEESNDHLALAEEDLHPLEATFARARRMVGRRQTPSERTRVILTMVRECDTPSERFRLAKKVLAEAEQSTRGS